MGMYQTMRKPVVLVLTLVALLIILQVVTLASAQHRDEDLPVVKVVKHVTTTLTVAQTPQKMIVVEDPPRYREMPKVKVETKLRVE